MLRVNYTSVSTSRLLGSRHGSKVVKGMTLAPALQRRRSNSNGVRQRRKALLSAAFHSVYLNDG